ncbi:hypothetical protein L9F63_022193, partial [Diploptera punctata]
NLALVVCFAATETLIRMPASKFNFDASIHSIRKVKRGEWGEDKSWKENNYKRFSLLTIDTYCMAYKRVCNMH